MARSKIKDVTGQMWERRLKRCNPFDMHDKDIEVARSEVMPNSGIIYSKFRGKRIDEVDELTLQNWANGDSGRSKIPKLEIQCLMVYVAKYGITEWRREGMTDNEIIEVLQDLGFLSATLN